MEKEKKDFGALEPYRKDHSEDKSKVALTPDTLPQGVCNWCLQLQHVQVSVLGIFFIA